MYTKKENDLSCYYIILGVSEQATLNEIKAAWHKKALHFHPDKNPGIDTTETMQKLNEAYEILLAKTNFKEKRAKSHFFQSWKGTCKPKSKPKTKSYAPVFKEPIYHQFGCGWSVKICDEEFMLICHPSLQGCITDISILHSKDAVLFTLPLNKNEALRYRLWGQLMSICRDYDYWYLCFVDLRFQLPKNRSLWLDIVDCISRIYKIPQALNHFIVAQMNFPPKPLKKLIPDFYAYPDMHHHDSWETHLTNRHVFLKHSTIQAADLTFFDLFQPQFYITLPTHSCKNAFAFFNDKLLPLLVHEQLVINNLYEIVIRLDKSKQVNDILECIFDFYGVPERIAQPIRQECDMSVNADNCKATYCGI